MGVVPRGVATCLAGREVTEVEPFLLKPTLLQRVGQVSFCCWFARQKMPRRGWHVSEDLSRAVWQEILRGPRPPAARWPTAQGSRQRQRSQGVRESMQVRQESIRGRGLAQGRRGSAEGRRHSVPGRRGSTGGRQDGAANPTRREGHGLPPDEVMANARARVSKLEAAIAAVGDSDPTCATLREALARAKSQAQERPVADCIREGEEEGSCTPGGCEDGSGGGGGRTREVGKGRILVARRRSSSAGVAAGRGQRDGLPGGSTHRPVQFCRRIGSVESMCARVADRTGRPPRQVAELRRSRGQGAQAAQDSRFTSSRFGSFEQKHYRQDRGHGWPVARRSVFCFSQDGDIDRERRFESSKWQLFQPIVILKGLSSRERAQYGLRGDRIGEAENPGPPSAVGDLDQAMEFEQWSYGPT